MKITEIKPPRKFRVPSIEISHCANIELSPDEQVTFVTESGKEYDVMRKSWGYFATPSINNRLKRFGLRAVLIQDSGAKLFVCLVEQGKEEDFLSYLDIDQARILCWLDNDESVQHLVETFEGSSERRY
jgi:hypothetical protein